MQRADLRVTVDRADRKAARGERMLYGTLPIAALAGALIQVAPAAAAAVIVAGLCWFVVGLGFRVSGSRPKDAGRQLAVTADGALELADARFERSELSCGWANATGGVNIRSHDGRWIRVSGLEPAEARQLLDRLELGPSQRAAIVGAAAPAAGDYRVRRLLAWLALAYVGLYAYIGVGASAARPDVVPRGA